MKKLIQLSAVLLTMFMGTKLFAASPAGTYTSIDDQSGKKRAVISVSVSGNTMSGTIVQVFPQPGDTGMCTNCPGGFKGKPVKGLTILWGLKDAGNGVWEGGKILDPKSGKIYNAKVTQQGNALYVRGYVGVSALGRTQIWKK